MQRGECKICDVFQSKFLWFSCTQGLIPKRECYFPRCILMSPAADSCFTSDRADEPLRPALSRFDMETQRLGTFYFFGFGGFVCFSIFFFWLLLPLKIVLAVLRFPLVVSPRSHFSVATVYNIFQVQGAAHQLAAGSWSPQTTEKRAKQSLWQNLVQSLKSRHYFSKHPIVIKPVLAFGKTCIYINLQERFFDSPALYPVYLIWRFFQLILSISSFGTKSTNPIDAGFEGMYGPMGDVSQTP